MIVGDGPLLVDTRERGKELVFPSLQHTHNISVDRIGAQQLPQAWNASDVT